MFTPRIRDPIGRYLFETSRAMLALGMFALLGACAGASERDQRVLRGSITRLMRCPFESPSPKSRVKTSCQ